MIKHVTTLIEKVTAPIKYLFDFKHTKYQFKLIDIIYSDKHNHKICHIHSSGKNIFFKLPAQEIINNPAFLSEFSQEDVVSITRLDNELEYITKTHPISIKEIIWPNEELTEPIIILYEIKKNNLIRLSLSDLLNNDKMIFSFKKEDTYKLGYLKGLFEEQNLARKKEIAKQQYMESLSKRKPRLYLVS